MAKKESNDIDLDLDFDMDGDFDMDFDSEFSAEAKAPKNRSAVSEVFTGTISGVKSKFTDPEFMGETVRKSLPASYDTAFDAANKTVSAGREIYDEAVKELKPQVGNIARSIDRMVPESLGIVKRTTSKIDRFFNGEERRGTSEASVEDQLVSNALTEVFGQQHELNKQERAEDKAEELIKDRIEEKRFKASHGLMGRISDNIDRMTSMKQTVDLAYQKKSLEIQVRSLFALQNLADKTIKFQEVTTVQNENIVKNTALPEFVKLQDSERFKEIAKNKFMGRFQESLMNVTGLDSILKSVKQDATDYIGGWKQGLSLGADGIEAIREQMEMMDSLNDPEAGLNFSKKEMAGQMAGGAAANFARDKFTNFIRSITSNNEGIESAGHTLTSIISNPGAFAKEFKNRDEFQEMLYGEGVSEWGARILEYFLDKARDNNSMDLTIDGSRVDNLKDAAVFTNKFVRSVEEVIPSWLASIHHELVRSNTPEGGDVPEPSRFDFRSNTIISAEKGDNAARAAVKKASENHSYKYNVKNTYDKLLDGAEIAEDHKREIEKFIMRFSREKDVRFVHEDIISSKAFKSLDKDAQRVLSAATENLSKDDDSLYRKEKEAQLSRGLYNIRKSTTDYRAVIEEEIRNNNADTFIKDGLVERKPDGSLVINEDEYMRRVEEGYFEKSDKNKKKDIAKFGKGNPRRRKSDVNTKEDIEPANMDSALDKIRTTDVYTWRYKKGEGDNKEHIGPMAQDVQKNMGDEAGPGGKEIDLINLNGIAMAGIQELADRVDALSDEGRVNASLLNAIAQNTAKTAELLESKEFMKFELPDEFLSKLGDSIKESALSAFESASEKSKGFFNKALEKGKAGVKTTGSIAGKIGKAGWNGVTGVAGWGKDVLVDPALNYLKDPETKKAITDSIGGAFKATFELGQSVMGQVKKTITERIPNALNFVKDKIKALGSVLYDGIIGPVDIFIKGSMEPAIQAVKMRAGEYYDDATGKVIRTLKDVEEATGNIRNKAGEVVLTLSQKAEGMYDGLGKRLHSKAVTAIQTATHIGGKLLGTAFKVAKKAGQKIGDALGLTDGRFSELADKVSESLKDTFGDGIGFGISKEADVAIQDVRDLLYRVYPEEAESVEANKQALRGDPAKRGKGLIKSIKDFLRGKDKDITPDEGGTDSVPAQEMGPQQTTLATPAQTAAPTQSESSGGGFFSNFYNNTKNRLKQEYAEYNRKKLDPSGDRGRTNLKVNDPESETVEIIDSLNKYGPEDLDKPEVKALFERAKALNPKEFIEAAKKYYSPEKIKEVQDKLSGNKVTKEVKELAEKGISALKETGKEIPGKMSEAVEKIKDIKPSEVVSDVKDKIVESKPADVLTGLVDRLIKAFEDKPETEVKESTETTAVTEKSQGKIDPSNPIEAIKGILNKGISSVKGSGFKPEENKVLTELLQKVGAGNLDISGLLDKAGNLKDDAIKTLQGLVTDNVKGTGREDLVNRGVNFLNTGFDKLKNLFGVSEEPKVIKPEEIAGPKFKGNKLFEWIKGKYDPEKVRGFRDRMEGIPLVGESLAARFDSGLLGKELNQDRTTLGQKLGSMKSKVGNFFSGKDSQESEAREANALDIIEKYKTLPNSTLGKFLNSSPGKRFLKTISSTPPDKVNDVARNFLGGFKDKRYLEAFERGKENVEKEWRGEPVEDESLMDRIKAGAGKAGKFLGDTKIGKGAKFLGKEFGMIGRSAAEIGGHIGKAGLNAVGINPDAVKETLKGYKDSAIDNLHALKIRAGEKLIDPAKQMAVRAKDVVVDKYGELKDKTKVGLQMAKDDLAARGRSVYNKALWAGAEIGDTLSPYLGKVKSGLSRAGGGIMDYQTAKYGTLRDAALNVKDKIFGSKDKSKLGIVDKVKLHAAHAADTVADKISPYTDKVKEKYSDAKGFVSDKVDAAKQKAKDFGNEFLENSPETRKLIEHWAPRVKKSKDFLKDKKAKAGDFVGDLTKRMGLEIAKDKVMDVKDRLLDKLGKKAKDTPLGEFVEGVAEDVAAPDTPESAKEEYSQPKKKGFFGSGLSRVKGFFGKKDKIEEAAQGTPQGQEPAAQAPNQQQPQQADEAPVKERGRIGQWYDNSRLGRSKIGRRLGGMTEAIGNSKIFQGAKGLVGGVLGGLFSATGTDTGGNNNDNIQQGAQMADYNANLSVDTSKGPSFNDKDGDGRRAGSWEDKYAKMEQEKRDRRKTNVLAKADTKYKSNQNIIDKMMGAAQGIVDNVAAIGGGLMEAAGDLFGGGGADKKGNKGGRNKGKGPKGKGKFSRLKDFFSRKKPGAATAGKTAGNAASKVGPAAAKNGFLKGSFGKMPGIATAVTVGMGAYDVYASESSDMSRDEKDLATGEAVGSTGGALVGMAAGAKAGALAGAVLGPVGAAAGGLIGGTIGGIAGSSVGTKVGSWLGSKWTSIRKSFGAGDVSDIDMIRMYQYGLGHTEESKSHIAKIVMLEEYLTDSRTGYNGTDAYLIEQKMTNEELLEIMGIDKGDKPTIAVFTNWFLERFKPVYLHHASIMADIAPKVKLSRINTLSKDEKKKYLERASLESAPYTLNASPFKGLPYLNSDREYATKMVEKLLKTEKTDKEKEKLAPPNVPKEISAEDALKESMKTQKEQDEKAVEQAKVAAQVAATANPNSSLAPGGKPQGGSESSKPDYAGEDGPKNELAGGNSTTSSGQGGGAEGAGAASFPAQPAIPSATGALKDGSGAAPFLKFNGKNVKIDTMNPTMKQRFLGMVQEYGEITGKSILVTSGTRTSEEQARLYRELGPKKAARPGRSLHEFGLAIDVNSPDNAALDKLGLMRKYGFTRPVGGETWHVEPAGIQGRNSEAKADPALASKMVAAGEGLGGGGIGSIRGTRLGSRDPNASKKLMEATTKAINAAEVAAKDPENAKAQMPPVEGGGTPGTTTAGAEATGTGGTPAAMTPTGSNTASLAPSATPPDAGDIANKLLEEAPTAAVNTPAQSTGTGNGPADMVIQPPSPDGTFTPPATTNVALKPANNAPSLPDLGEPEPKPQVAGETDSEAMKRIVEKFPHLPQGRPEGNVFDAEAYAKPEAYNRETAERTKNTSLESHAKSVAALAQETPEERDSRQDKLWKQMQGIYDEPETPAAKSIDDEKLEALKAKRDELIAKRDELIAKRDALMAGNTPNGTVATPESTKVDTVPEVTSSSSSSNTSISTGSSPVDSSSQGSSPSSSSPPPSEGGKYGQVKAVITEGAKKVGMDPNMMQTVAAVESSLNPNAKAKTSSAKGLFQFLNATWEEQIKKHGRKYGLKPNTSALDPFASTVMAGEYFKANLRTIKSLRPNPNATDAYLTHFLGPGGAHRFLKASPEEVGAKVLPNAAKSNPGIFKHKDGRNKTIGEIYRALGEKISQKARAFGVVANVGDMEVSGKTPTQENVDKVTTMTGNMEAPAYTGNGQPATEGSGTGSSSGQSYANAGSSPTGSNPNFSTVSGPTGMSATPAVFRGSMAQEEVGSIPSDRSTETASNFARFDPVTQPTMVDKSSDPSRTGGVESQLTSLVDINQQQLDISKQLLSFIQQELPKLTGEQKVHPALQPKEEKGSSSIMRTNPSPSYNRVGNLPSSEINLGRRSTSV